MRFCRPLPQPDTISSARILIRGHAFLGDALMTTPFLSQLAQHNPASITVSTSGSGAEVYRRHPAVDHLVTDPRELQKEYDIDFVLKDSGRAALASRRLGTPMRIGFRGEGSRLLLTHALPRRQTHGALRYFPLLGSAAPDAPAYSFPITERERSRAATRTGGTHNALLFSPGSTRPEKEWPEKHFIALIRRLATQQPERPLFLLGSPTEKKRCSRIAAATGTTSLAGRTTLGELAAILAQGGLLVSGDSGTMHLAHAAGCPSLALFGQTDPTLSGPPPGARATVIKSPLPCRGCLRRRCGKDAPCMEAITPEMVFETMMGILDKQQ